MKFKGVHGHLATITSSAENAFISTQLGTTQFAWLGGEQPPGSLEPDGGWQWITGEPWVYTNWDIGEPNNDYQVDFGRSRTISPRSAYTLKPTALIGMTYPMTLRS